MDISGLKYLHNLIQIKQVETAPLLHQESNVFLFLFFGPSNLQLWVTKIQIQKCPKWK